MISKKEKTREHIVKSAYALFAKKGFNSVTMKDVCEVTGLSRGGLYSHFSSTEEIFKIILQELGNQTPMDFNKNIISKESATNILNNALILMENEMNHSENSLSLAIYEYADYVGKEFMDEFNDVAERKWKELIEYGIANGEFNDVNASEIVDIILYVYQGVRMWSRIVTMQPETVNNVINYLRKQLLKED